MPFDIRRFDVYRKIPKDFTQPTLAGAIISIISGLMILFLVFSELTAFLTVETVSELYVDNPTAEEDVPVRLNITIPRLKCDFIGLDIQDDMGRHEVGFQGDIAKIPVNDDSGCRMEAKFSIKKVPGNFHVSTHSSRMQPQTVDMAHYVHHLEFGEARLSLTHLQGSFNPLKDIDKTDKSDEHSHDYYMKIVPTTYSQYRGSTLNAYQYTYAYKHFTSWGHHRSVPAIWFRYDLNPITVRYTDRVKPFYHFITTICAIVGGTFTVAGIVDSCVFTAHEVFRKMELGKLS
jgi:hypothetical protein